MHDIVPLVADHSGLTGSTNVAPGLISVVRIMSSFPGLNTTLPLFRYHDLCQVQTQNNPGPKNLSKILRGGRARPESENSWFDPKPQPSKSPRQSCTGAFPQGALIIFQGHCLGTMFNAHQVLGVGGLGIPRSDLSLLLLNGVPHLEA